MNVSKRECIHIHTHIYHLYIHVYKWNYILVNIFTFPAIAKRLACLFVPEQEQD